MRGKGDIRHKLPVQPDDTEKVAVVQRYRSAMKPAMANLKKLIATIA